MAAIASRYARAMVDVVLDQKLDPAATVKQVYDLVGAVRGSADLRKVWESPAVAVAQKRALLDAIASQSGVSRQVRNFFAVLIDHGRVRMVERIARQFEIELNTQLGFVEADIRSSRALGDQERRELESQVASMTGKKVQARYATDAQLIGGVVVRIGSTIYDGSVRGQLQKLKEQLSTA